MSSPKFTIGVTTYNRRDLLRACLDSVLAQRYEDYEVIVGNDFPQDNLTPSIFGLGSRFRFINRRINVGEMTNMNLLLGEARGEYFTWLADDDMLAPNYLGTMLDALETSGHNCVFCDYWQGETYPYLESGISGRVVRYSGAAFLEEYLSKGLKTLGVYAAFKRNYIVGAGGMRTLGSGFSPYSDNLLVLQAGLQSEVTYVEAPLVFLRTHSQSISFSSKDLTSFFSAQVDFAEASMEVMRHPRLRNRFRANLALLSRWLIDDTVGLIVRSGGIESSAGIAHLAFLSRLTRECRERSRLLFYGLRRSVGALLRLLVRRLTLHTHPSKL